MIYIGIRGHRGAGKGTVAYLLGNCIDYIVNKKQAPTSQIFNTWCDEILADEKAINKVALENVYFEAFSDSLKVFISLLLGVSQEDLYDDYYKDHAVVNLRDFSITVYDEVPTGIYNSKTLYESMPYDAENSPSVINSNRYILLRDFILYFGYEVFQRFFGNNVWVKTLTANSFTFFDEEGAYKIYYDVKTSCETSYIKNKNGYIIKVVRPGHKKKPGLEILSKDDKVDFELTMSEQLYESYENILNIANKIINDERTEN